MTLASSSLYRARSPSRNLPLSSDLARRVVLSHRTAARQPLAMEMRPPRLLVGIQLPLLPLHRRVGARGAVADMERM